MSDKKSKIEQLNNKLADHNKLSKRMTPRQKKIKEFMDKPAKGKEDQKTGDKGSFKDFWNKVNERLSTHQGYKKFMPV